MWGWVQRSPTWDSTQLHNFRWQQQAVCRQCTQHCYLEPQPPCQNPTPSPLRWAHKVAPLLTYPGQHVLYSESLPLSIFWSNNKAFLCFWIEFSLILLTLMIPGSRTHCWGSFFGVDSVLSVLFQNTSWNVSRPSFDQMPFSESTSVNMELKCSKRPRLNHVPIYRASGRGPWW